MRPLSDEADNEADHAYCLTPVSDSFVMADIDATRVATIDHRSTGRSAQRASISRRATPSPAQSRRAVGRRRAGHRRDRRRRPLLRRRRPHWCRGRRVPRRDPSHPRRLARGAGRDHRRDRGCGAGRGHPTRRGLRPAASPTPAARFGVPAAKLGLAVDHKTVQQVATLGRRQARRGRCCWRREEIDGAARLRAWARQPARRSLADAHGVGGRRSRSLAPLTIAGHKLALNRLEPDLADAEVDAAVSQSVGERRPAGRPGRVRREAPPELPRRLE